MASLVDTSVKYAHSDMVGAPVLNAPAGALISLLDAFLVTGWGMQTAVSLVVSGGVATITFPNEFPATVASVVLVAGATPEPLNGEQKVIATGFKQASFATAAADGTATGTITVKMAPAGWAKAFSDTNVAVYKSQHPQAHSGGMYLRVQDDVINVARVVGYESMVDASSGVGMFPSASQVSGGGYWFKSITGTAAAARWALAADARTLLINVAQGRTSSSTYVLGNTRMFGDLIPRRITGDPYAVALTVSPTSGTTGVNGSLDNPTGVANSILLARPAFGLGTSESCVARPYIGSNTITSGSDTFAGTFPSSVSGELLLSKIFLSTNSTSPPRGDVPGLYSVPQQVTAATMPGFTLIPGGGDLLGRTLMCLNPGGVQTTITGGGLSLVDVTGPWR